MRQREQRWRLAGAAMLVAVACALFPCAGTKAQAAPPPCGRADFETVVAGAAEALRSITQKNSPAFQAKLRELKDKRGWSHEQFLAEGARFVRDDRIATFDEQSGALLAKINEAGNEAGNQAGNQADASCTQLAGLKANMTALVDIQTAKWAYMFSSVDGELAR